MSKGQHGNKEVKKPKKGAATGQATVASRRDAAVEYRGAGSAQEEVTRPLDAAVAQLGPYSAQTTDYRAA